MPQLYIKICGLRTSDSVTAAVDAGANAVGFVFAPGSPRIIDPQSAAGLAALVPQDVETVGVFRNQPLDMVIEMARTANLSTVQLHGDESHEDILALRAAGFRTLRAFTVDSYEALSTEERGIWESERILIDAVEPGAGVTFDASSVLAEPPMGTWLLAGGLNPANVAGLVKTLNPSGVDVSSGVESSRGVKDLELIVDFIRAARSAE